MAKFCNNGHQMEDAWTDCPYCVRTGYRGAAIADKTRADLAATRVEVANGREGAVDLSKTVPLASVRRGPVVGWLVALNGVQKGEDFRLREGKNGVGSGTGSEVILRDSTVSANHASISYKDGRFVITDLDSTNGTYLNDDPNPVARIELTDNDVIRLGESVLKFKCL
jgi:hypothetical protein